MEKVKHILEYASELLKYYFLYPFSICFFHGKNIYLISERGNEARDNGYHLFKYYREKYPEKEVYYVITRNSADLPKIEHLGNIVIYRSLRHYMLFIASNYKISTHIMGFSPNRFFYTNYSKLIHLRGKKIFLQHGVIKDDLPQLYQEKTELDMFVCGARPEYDFVNSKFHYDDGQVVYTGLARFDGLWERKTKNQILIMPTWRMYLKYTDDKEVQDSEYVHAWNSLLNNEKLLKIIEKENITLIFYPHYEMQTYLHFFGSKSEKVIIADIEHYDVQQLLKESKLLITDYSSVYFDFAYMNKPCVYYQFDRKKFFERHYEKGYFDYKKMGFGPVEKEESFVIEDIIEIIENNFEMQRIYQERVKQFFEKYDKCNCNRIANEIEKL